MEQGLLQALRKYAPAGQKVDPLENFITEAFAWLLKTESDFSQYFLKKITERLGLLELDLSMPEWNTQYELDGKYPDMVCTLKYFVLIFEHKAWSELHENQLKNYHDRAKKVFDDSHRIILITANKQQHSQKSDLSLCWSDVYIWIEQWKAKQESFSFIFNDFLKLLSYEGMGPVAPVAHLDLMNYGGDNRVEQSLGSILSTFKADQFNYVLDGQRKEELDYWCPGKKWGRMGFNILSWKPSIFVGVMLEGGDHCVKPSDVMKGPDFCIMLSFINEYHRFYPKSQNYKSLVQDLKDEFSSSSDWSVYEHIKDPKAKRKNKYHPLYIRKPALEVFRGTSTLDEQYLRFKNNADFLVKRVVAKASFWALRKEMSAIKE